MMGDVAVYPNAVFHAGIYPFSAVQCGAGNVILGKYCIFSHQPRQPSMPNLSPPFPGPISLSVGDFPSTVNCGDFVAIGRWVRLDHFLTG